MRFSINQTELQTALSVVSKGAAARSTLPILSGIYLEAREDELVLQATDLEKSIRYSVSALVEDEGRVVVPGKLFTEIVKSLPDAAVHVVTEDDAALVTCDSSSFSIKTLDAADFPSFPQVSVQQSISIPFPCLAGMVKRVARTVSKDESRAILTGVLVSLEDSVLKMVATDSYRLAVTESVLVDAPANDFEAVISGSFLQEVSMLPRTEEAVTISLADNQILVKYLDTVLINRRLEGNFPNYRQLLPEGYATRVSMDLDHLVSAVKRSSLLGQGSSTVRFDINIASQTVQLSASAQDVGSARETLPCEGGEEDVEIAFNYSYILDGLSSVGTDKVYLEVQSSLKPGIFKADEPESFLYLVMPVRIA